MPAIRSKQIINTGAGVYQQTRTLIPMSETKVKYVTPRRLDDFKNTKEVLTVMKDAMIAHQTVYYKAGYLHANITLETMMILEDSYGRPRGVLLDLDNADSFRRAVRPDMQSLPQPSAKGKEREVS